MPCAEWYTSVDSRLLNCSRRPFWPSTLQGLTSEQVLVQHTEGSKHGSHGLLPVGLASAERLLGGFVLRVDEQRLREAVRRLSSNPPPNETHHSVMG
eukprot:167311-Pyramimonas_sp.AAC.2